MTLEEAISVVKARMPMLALMGAEVNAAASLVLSAAIAYEEATWEYQYEVFDASGVSIWISGHPSSEAPARQRRRRGSEVEYGVWSKTVNNEKLPPLNHEDCDD